jgi:hypothetical protein
MPTPLSDWYGYDEKEALDREQEEQDWLAFRALDQLAEYYEKKEKEGNRYVPIDGIKTWRDSRSR